MDRTNKATLARIWADATPLVSFIEQKAAQTVREAPRTSQASEARTASTMEQVAKNLQIHLDLAAAREIVRAATINDLVAGRLVGLGRPSDSSDFERIDALFWIGAAINWTGAVVSRDGRNLIEIRMVSPDVVAAWIPNVQSGMGRPSKGDVILLAIADYAKKDPALKQSPFVRFKAYRAFISNQGFDVRKPGFSEKTLQKYEREFRLTFK